ncbi:hypothetical protein B296_00011789 [Ensete ventricosum]|uniref:RING-type E3 ubiquitin transferase n=1 Tax=Ensete ventricosum TaxID=4639 RepID=A0A427AMN4_ENSVE|nr:hypothetical protein B296_00011789 [Ensete ventricosum]
MNTIWQANQRIIDAVSNRLEIPSDKVISNLANYGNTSAASIPLALDEAVRGGKIQAGNTIATAGFGAGLTWGSAIISSALASPPSSSTAAATAHLILNLPLEKVGKSIDRMSQPGDEFGGGVGGDTTVVKISSEVMVAAVVFLFMVVVFVFFLYLYSKHYLRPDPAIRGRRSRARFVFAAADGLGAGGLDAAVLRVLPVTVYRAADFKEGLECSVCLSELSDGEQARLLPKCNHGFHLECIDMWFHSHSTCPLCRSPVGAEPSTKPDSDAEAQIPPLQTLQESPVFPTNVLFWGDHDRVNAGSSTTETVADGGSSQEGPSSSSGRSGKPEGSLVIEIPRSAVDDLLSPISPLPSSRMAMEETRSPVSATFRSLRRLWSHGRWTAGSSSSPRGGDIEQGLGGCAETSLPPPKSPSNS